MSLSIHMLSIQINAKCSELFNNIKVSFFTIHLKLSWCCRAIVWYCSFWLHWTLVNFTYSDEHEPMPYADTNYQIWQTCLGSLAQGKFQTQIKICILQIKVREASLCWHKVNLSIEFHVLLHEEPRTDACASLFEGPPNGHLDRVALPPPANFSGTFSYNPSLFSFKIFPLSWKVKNTYEKLLRLIYHDKEKMTICGWKSRILATFDTIRR